MGGRPFARTIRQRNFLRKQRMLERAIRQKEEERQKFLDAMQVITSITSNLPIVFMTDQPPK